MDRIIKITLGIFIVILVSSSAFFTYTGFVENAYRNSLYSTYTYTCALSTDSPLYNVTFFIPVPGDRAGNSPMITKFSAHEVNGIPESWQTTLYDSGKVTMLKITTPSVIPPAGTTAGNPYVISFGLDLSVKGPVDTSDPVLNSAMFRPVLNIIPAACPAGTPAGASCSTYLTSVYADYSADPNAAVKFTAALTGKNTWKIFEQKSNRYQTEIQLLMFGGNHGWTFAQGSLVSGIGDQDAPALTA